MKKIILSLFCFVSLYAETSFFLGFGGGYFTEGKMSSTGPSATLNGKLNHTLWINFLKFEGILGFETIFSNHFGIRYYANLARGNLMGAEKDKSLVDSELGFNFDLLFKFPINETLALRFYSGINFGSHSLRGALITDIARQFDHVRKTMTNYAIRYTSGLSVKSFNIGLHLLFDKDHVIEFGSRIPLEKNELTIFRYKQLAFPQSQNSKIVFDLPYLDLSLKYIFIF